jgi:hypothetical protein
MSVEVRGSSKNCVPNPRMRSERDFAECIVRITFVGLAPEIVCNTLRAARIDSAAVDSVASMTKPIPSGVTKSLRFLSILGSPSVALSKLGELGRKKLKDCSLSHEELMSLLLQNLCLSEGARGVVHSLPSKPLSKTS